MIATRTMRGTAALTLIALLAACSNDSHVDTGGSDSDTAVPGHPLVPAEYRWYWNTDGCELDDAPAAQVYWLAEGEATDGSLAMTETWYWFFGRDDLEGDCLDVFELTGTLDPDVDFVELGCPDCDVAWRVTRTLTPRTGADRCDDATYHDRFGLSEAPEDQAYTGYVLLDTLDADGVPYPEGRMAVVQANERPGGFYGVDAEFATGRVEGDEPRIYEWLGDRCVPW